MAYDFITYKQDGSVGYQNIAMFICKIQSNYDGCNGDDVYIDERGGVSGTITVDASATSVFAYVSPYGSESDTESAYGGTWSLELCPGRTSPFL